MKMNKTCYTLGECRELFDTFFPILIVRTGDDELNGLEPYDPMGM